jgi:hypothetical protein
MLTAESNLSQLFTTDLQLCFQPHISSDTFSTISPFENRIYFIVENNKAQGRSRKLILLLLISGIAFLYNANFTTTNTLSVTFDMTLCALFFLSFDIRVPKFSLVIQYILFYIFITKQIYFL